MSFAFFFLVLNAYSSADVASIRDDIMTIAKGEDGASRSGMDSIRIFLAGR